jgi:hypothetical protein
VGNPRGKRSSSILKSIDKDLEDDLDVEFPEDSEDATEEGAESELETLDGAKENSEELCDDSAREIDQTGDKLGRWKIAHKTPARRPLTMLTRRPPPRPTRRTATAENRVCKSRVSTGERESQRENIHGAAERASGTSRASREPCRRVAKGP